MGFARALAKRVPALELPRARTGARRRWTDATRTSASAREPDRARTFAAECETLPGAATRRLWQRGAYQVWYRNAASFCTPSTFNLSNGIEIAWDL
jgi:hypothetical protein